jgi:hypothetical protein
VLSQTAATRLRHQLTELPDLCAHAWLSLAPSLERRPATIRGTRLDAPLPLREDVLSLLGPGDYIDHDDPHGDQIGPMPIRAVLAAWCQLLLGQAHWNITTACQQLLEHHLPLCERKEAEEYAEQIGELHALLMPMARCRPGRRPLQLPCPRCSLFALSVVDGQDPECGECGTILRPAEYDRRADAWAEALGA